jgi:hypothetical protein
MHDKNILIIQLPLNFLKNNILIWYSHTKTVEHNMHRNNELFDLAQWFWVTSALSVCN